MRKKIRSLYALARVAVFLAALAWVLRDSIGLNLQVAIMVVVLTAYRKGAAKLLRETVAPPWHEEPQAQTERGQGTTAFHEAGHVVVGFLLPGASKPYRATIVPSADANGHVDNVRRSADPHDLDGALDELASWFAGAAAEREFGGRQNSGWGDDLENATWFARQMVCAWGFSPKLPRRTYDPGSGLLTEELRTLINAEIDRYLEMGEKRAIETVKAHHDLVGQVAALLLQHKTLDRAKLEAAIGKQA